MGLRNDSATFQALINFTFYEATDYFLGVYLDDILFYSDSRDEHLMHLRTVLRRLKENELFVGARKYQLMTRETDFLGLQVGQEGISIRTKRKRFLFKISSR